MGVCCRWCENLKEMLRRQCLVGLRCKQPIVAFRDMREFNKAFIINGGNPRAAALQNWCKKDEVWFIKYFLRLI